MNPNVDGLTAAQQDRATGAMVGMAVGNALGNGYAFEPPPDPDRVKMRVGGLGPYGAGEWADDMDMALPLLEMLAVGTDLATDAGQDAVAARWAQWFSTAKDVAPIVTKVLSAYDPAVGAESLRREARQYQGPDTTSPAGNASLMRTTPLTLGYLHDPDQLTAVSQLYSGLTHGSPQAAQACALWNLAQREAILYGRFDLSAGLPWLPEASQSGWEQLITRAEIGLPQDFALHNGLVTHLIQTVWSAINNVDDDGPEHFERTLRLVISAGGDTGTAGAIAGALLGARWGVSAIPLQWRRQVHGWPGIGDIDVVRLVWQVLHRQPWPALFGEDPGDVPVIQHPVDPGVYLGGAAGLRPLPAGVDTIMSLHPLGSDQMPVPGVASTSHINVWLIDSSQPDDNPNLGLVADQAVRMLADLRGEGSTVYLHGLDGRSSAPFIAALYGARVGRVTALEVLDAIAESAPTIAPNPVFTAYLRTV